MVQECTPCRYVCVDCVESQSRCWVPVACCIAGASGAEGPGAELEETLDEDLVQVREREGERLPHPTPAAASVALRPYGSGFKGGGGRFR